MELKDFKIRKHFSTAKDKVPRYSIVEHLFDMYNYERIFRKPK